MASQQKYKVKIATNKNIGAVCPNKNQTTLNSQHRSIEQYAHSGEVSIWTWAFSASRKTEKGNLKLSFIPLYHMHGQDACKS